MGDVITCPCCAASTVAVTHGRLLRWAWVWTPFCARRSLLLIWAAMLGLFVGARLELPLIAELQPLLASGALLLGLLLGAVYGTSEAATLVRCRACRTGWVQRHDEPAPLPRRLFTPVRVAAAPRGAPAQPAARLRDRTPKARGDGADPRPLNVAPVTHGVEGGQVNSAPRTRR